MIVSPLKAPQNQPRLFDEPIGNHGHVRTLIGEWTEELLARLLGCDRHRTSSRCDYCPDLSRDGQYFETKACGRTNQTFVYAGRLVKDRQFVEAGHPLQYAILSHGCDTGRYEMVSELREAWLESLQALYLVPFDVLEQVAHSNGEQKLNSRYGNSDRNPAHGSGYRVSLSSLSQYKTISLEFLRLTYKRGYYGYKNRKETAGRGARCEPRRAVADGNSEAREGVAAGRIKGD